MDSVVSGEIILQKVRVSLNCKNRLLNRFNTHQKVKDILYKKIKKKQMVEEILNIIMYVGIILSFVALVSKLLIK